MSRLLRSASLRLPDEGAERHSTWLEIFFDLIFAVIAVKVSERLLSHFSFIGIYQCSALFIPVMWTWASYTVFAARFDNNDALHWFMTFVIMFAGIVMAIQIPIALESGSGGFAIGFLIGQISLLILYSRTSYDHVTPKSLTTLYMIGFGAGGICWMISLLFDPPNRYILWLLGTGIYLITPWAGKKRILSKAPLDTIYIPERFGAFTIIILGQIIASVVLGLESASWSPYSVFISILAFALAILIWGQYYTFTKIADYKCTLGSGQPFIYVHIPLIMSLIIIGACAENFITNPFLIHGYMNVLFCFAVILYLTSFCLLQYIALRKFKIQALFYLVGIVVILLLSFFQHLSPSINMIIAVLVFMALLGLQYATHR